LRRRTGAAWFHFVGLTLKLALWAAASQNPELFAVANRYTVSTAARREKSGAFAALCEMHYEPKKGAEAARAHIEQHRAAGQHLWPPP
jgi:hypothetical protein